MVGIFVRCQACLFSYTSEFVNDCMKETYTKAANKQFRELVKRQAAPDGNYIARAVNNVAAVACVLGAAQSHP
jgi:hypothetical protein